MFTEPFIVNYGTFTLRFIIEVPTYITINLSKCMPVYGLPSEQTVRARIMKFRMYVLQGIAESSDRLLPRETFARLLNFPSKSHLAVML